MVRKRILPIALGVFLISFALPITSVFATSVGKSCATAGALAGTKKNPLVCKKVGKKLIWQKYIAPSNTSIPLTIPTTAPEPVDKPVVSNVRIQNLVIKQGESAFIAFTVTSIIGFRSTSGIVSFSHVGGAGFSSIFSVAGYRCVLSSPSVLECEGEIPFSNTATVGAYRLSITAYTNTNNVAMRFFTLENALSVTP